VAKNQISHPDFKKSSRSKGQGGISKVGSMALNVQDGRAIIDCRIKGTETISICLVTLLRLFPLGDDVL